MTQKTRILILRANAVWLLVASTLALGMDIAGAFFNKGPESIVLAGSPGAAIGFIEAHGLAFIFGMLLWHAPSERRWHLTGAAIHQLLGLANLVFFQMFLIAQVLPMGIITTAIHFVFVTLELFAFASMASTADRAPSALADRVALLPPFPRSH